MRTAGSRIRSIRFLHSFQHCRWVPLGSPHPHPLPHRPWVQASGSTWSRAVPRKGAASRGCQACTPPLLIKLRIAQSETTTCGTRKRRPKLAGTLGSAACPAPSLVGPLSPAKLGFPVLLCHLQLTPGTNPPDWLIPVTCSTPCMCRPLAATS